MSHPSPATATARQQQPSSSNFPTMQELRETQCPIYQLPGKLGLIWQLNGPLDHATILIKQGSAAPEPYYNVTTSQYHSLATSSLTEPKISSITVRVNELELWEDQWLEEHCRHSVPDADDNGPDVEWKAFPDWDPSVDEGEMQLVRCCGETRPRDKNSSLTVTPARDGQGYVTIHDYISALHPWLVSLRGDLIGALTALHDQPFGPEVQLSVNSTALDELTIETELNMFPAQGGSPVLPGAEPVVYGRTEDHWPSPYHPEMLRLAGISPADVFDIRSH